MRHRAPVVAALLGVAFAASASADARPDENRFGTIRVEGKKVGNVHYTISYDERGVVDELRTRASYSVLGLQVYHFSQQLYERWRGGTLQSFLGDTDDNGNHYHGELTRSSDRYDAALNGKALQIPDDAFPASIWQFRITEQRLLFSLSTFELMKVEVSESSETIRIDGRSIDTRRFDFSGDWKASIWYDSENQVVQFERWVDGHKTLVTLDPD